MPNSITLSIQEVKDYLYCPKYYKLSHIDKVPQPSSANAERCFEESIRQTIFFFFNNIQASRVLSLAQLRKKFGDLYIGSRTVEETLFLSRSWRNTARKLEKLGIPTIKNFYDRFSDSHGFPIMVNKPYSLKIGNTTVTGHIPIIRETANKKIEMLDIYVTTKRSDANTLQTLSELDISSTASMLAFKKLYGEDVNLSIYSPYTKHMLSVTKSKKVYEVFFNLIKNVSTSMERNLYYPVLNQSCVSCIYNDKCARC